MTSAAAHRAPSANLLASIAQGIILSWGWRRRAIAFASGAIGALALPPFSLMAAMAPPLTVAVWLIDGSAAGRRTIGGCGTAFSAGWWWGFGYFVAGLWWVGMACLVDVEKFAWAMPLGVLALPAGLALFPAGGFVLARLLWTPGPARVLALALGLGLSEWARCLIFTGFPWNDLGMTIGANLTLAQIASFVGLHGLTFMAVAIFAAPATLWRVGENRFVLAPTILAALALALITIFGVVRLMTSASPAVPGAKLRLIQPAISQGASFSPENRDAILASYFALSNRKTAAAPRGVQDVTHLIWPEIGVPLHPLARRAGARRHR